MFVFTVYDQTKHLSYNYRRSSSTYPPFSVQTSFILVVVHFVHHSSLQNIKPSNQVKSDCFYQVWFMR